MKRHALRPGTVDRARRLRRNSTDAESVLWFALRDKLPAARFRRQVAFGPFFADFASHGAKLIVEVDGGQHNQDRDASRTAFLNDEGYRVMRFWNNDVLQNLEGVLQTIAAALPSPLVGEGGPKDRMRGAERSSAPALRAGNPSPQPSPTRGEGVSDNLSVGVR
jgi:very-short-patch-repair endonuclease